jgi:hypothetical protein
MSTIPQSEGAYQESGVSTLKAVVSDNTWIYNINKTFKIIVKRTYSYTTQKSKYR